MKIERKKKILIYTAIGVDKGGKKEVIGFWISYKEEISEFWKMVLEDLYQRGIRRVLLFVSDNFPSSKRDKFPFSRLKTLLGTFFEEFKGGFDKRRI